MKTTKKSGSLLAILFLLIFGFTNSAKAQCPYFIQNNLSCVITVQYEQFNPACSGFCFAPSSTTIAAGATFTIPCGSCVRVCNVKIQLVDIGGNSLSFGADFNNPNIPITPPFNFCSAANILYNPPSQTFSIN
jgi:hypothetical protein